MVFTEEINPGKITSAEMVVSIPSYNEADNIAYPTAMASEGLVKYFGDKKSVIINCDNNSPDGTREAFLDTPTDVPKIYISTPPGVKGKGNNFKNLFKKVVGLKAQSIIVVDADLKSITPQWIKRLGEPLVSDFGYVTPLYVRHKYDGTITNSIAYPLIRALYGRRVRQPIGGDFGFSGHLAEAYLLANTWTEAVSQFGIDVWMTSLATTNSFPVCQSFMGRPKIHKPKDPGSDLGPMFSQVVGTIFELMIKTAPFWKAVKWSKPTSIFGFGLGEIEMPPAVDVDTHQLFNKFTSGFDQNPDLYREIFTEETYNKLEEIRGLSEEQFDFPTGVWVRILFEIAIAYKQNVGNNTGELLEALIPLYFGKTLAFVKKTERMAIQEAEEFIENEAMVFERAKPYLIENWPI